MQEWKIILKNAFNVIVGANLAMVLTKLIVLLVTIGPGKNYKIYLSYISKFINYIFPETLLKAVHVGIQIPIQMIFLMELAILVRMDVKSVRGLKPMSALIVILQHFK
jgi:hypothetical protein